MITKITQKAVEVIPFLLPPDLSDRFAAAGWCQPEIYLDAEVRNGISSFAKMSSDEVETGIEKLKTDINSGAWDDKYSYLKQQQEYDAGYRLIIVE